jgi:hypothetical protein
MINHIIINEIPNIKTEISFINEINIPDLQTQIDNIIIPDYEEDILDLQTQINNLNIPPDYSDQITNINNNINVISDNLNNITASNIYFTNNNNTEESTILGEISTVINACLGNNGMTMYDQILFSSIIPGFHVSTIARICNFDNFLFEWCK